MRATEFAEIRGYLLSNKHITREEFEKIENFLVYEIGVYFDPETEREDDDDGNQE